MTASSPTAPTGAAPAASRPARKSPVPLLIVGALALAAIVFGWRRLEFSRRFVTTDNAQIDGHITVVAPRVQAFVARVLVEDNQTVAAGDTLIVLDDRDLRVRLEQAEADLASALATVGSRGRIGQAPASRQASEAAAKGALANVDAAQATLKRAQADFDRYQGLAAQKIVSAQQLDQARWAVENAKAALAAAERQASAAESQTDAASAGVQVAEARLAAARAAVETARLQLSYTVILAPEAGIVARRTVEPGTLVSVGQSLLSLVPSERIWVTANLKETQLSRIAVGNEVEFTVDAYPGATFHGTVESLSPATGAKFALLPPDNATGNFTKVVQRVPVRISVDPAGVAADHPLRPGMSVEVQIRAS
ncbi:MAG: HlyD family secretion protein [Gemmatimonadales bacterium]